MHIKLNKNWIAHLPPGLKAKPCATMDSSLRLISGKVNGRGSEGRDDKSKKINTNEPRPAIPFRQVDTINSLREASNTMYSLKGNVSDRTLTGNTCWAFRKFHKMKFTVKDACVNFTGLCYD
jgi:hypothetical protein